MQNSLNGGHQTEMPVGFEPADDLLQRLGGISLLDMQNLAGLHPQSDSPLPGQVGGIGADFDQRPFWNVCLAQHRLRFGTVGTTNGKKTTIFEIQRPFFLFLPQKIDDMAAFSFSLFGKNFLVFLIGCTRQLARGGIDRLNKCLCLLVEILVNRRSDGGGRRLCPPLLTLRRHGGLFCGGRSLFATRNRGTRCRSSRLRVRRSLLGQFTNPLGKINKNSLFCSDTHFCQGLVQRAKTLEFSQFDDRRFIRFRMHKRNAGLTNRRGRQKNGQHRQPTRFASRQERGQFVFPDEPRCEKIFGYEQDSNSGLCQRRFDGWSPRIPRFDLPGVRPDSDQPFLFQGCFKRHKELQCLFVGTTIAYKNRIP